jgi:hypothetical protein
MNLGLYDYNRTFYTGTDIQPDLLHVFIKPEKNAKDILGCSLLPAASWVGFLPVFSSFSGAVRVVNAVKIIFRLLSETNTQDENVRKAELWNAFKNIFRGIGEMIPCTGIVLILYESIRSQVLIGRITEELSQQENVAGIAIDGKILVTIDLKKLDSIITNPPTDSNLNEYRLAVFKDLCLQFLEKMEKKNPEIGMSKCLPMITKIGET